MMDPPVQLAPTRPERRAERLALLRALLGNAIGAGGAVPAFDRDDALWLEQLADKGRLLLLLMRVPAFAAASTPATVKLAVQRARMLSLANQSSLRRVIPELKRDSIPFTILKGPLQQQLAYDDREIVTSVDIDVLVAERDYDRAAAAISRQGYAVAPQCISPWWRRFLGEQPFLDATGRGLTIDLHHRLQQPGCPPPSDSRFFLDGNIDLPVGSVQAPTLNPQQASLLAAISFAKALWHREPSGRYACDLAALLEKMEPHRRVELVALAGRLGLANTVRLALRAAALISPALLAAAGSAPLPLAEIDDDRLGMLVFDPDGDDAGWPRRHRLLWALCDGNRRRERLAIYLVEQARLLASEACRLLWSPTPSTPSP